MYFMYAYLNMSQFQNRTIGSWRGVAWRDLRTINWFVVFVVILACVPNKLDFSL